MIWTEAHAWLWEEDLAWIAAFRAARSQFACNSMEQLNARSVRSVRRKKIGKISRDLQLGGKR